VQAFIRSELGESVLASARPCACGSPLPAIRAEGRRDDILALRATDGHVIRLSPLALTTVVEDAAPGHRFQLVQTAPDQIDVRLDVANPGERNAEWDAAEKALNAYLAHQSLANVRVCLDATPPAPDPRSGKLREVIAAIRP
jgi:phenylacetate-coenzyme A ligase PaaK-like adenylate-forming protein